MPRRKAFPRDVELKARLDELVSTFDISTISPDPLELPRRYSEPLDQEIAAILAAAFAYGRAEIIVEHIGAVLDAMGPSPFRYVATLDRKEALRRFRGFTHRFHKAPDLVALLDALSIAIRSHGSLGKLFERVDSVCIGADKGKDAQRGSCTPGTSRNGQTVQDALGASVPGAPDVSPDIRDALTAFVDAILESWVAAHPREKALEKSLRYLLSSPRDGSACKRMNLFLRWMVRRTSPDLGLWTFVEPSRLVIPLDTHVHRITTFLGLNDRKSGDWKAARAITDRLATFDRSDPTRYDFAICRLGILDRCSVKISAENCAVCLLREVCQVRK